MSERDDVTPPRVRETHSSWCRPARALLNDLAWDWVAGCTEADSAGGRKPEARTRRPEESPAMPFRHASTILSNDGAPPEIGRPPSLSQLSRRSSENKLRRHLAD